MNLIVSNIQLPFSDALTLKLEAARLTVSFHLTAVETGCGLIVDSWSQVASVMDVGLAVLVT